jgi:hypothetical protein
MPFHYERDDDGQRIRILMTGHVSTADVLGIVDRQAREGTWSYSVLYDTRAVTNLPTTEDLHRVVMRVGTLTVKHGPRGPVALVTTSPQLSRLGRAYASLGQLTALNVRIFTSVEEAEDWLSRAHHSPT